jgi:hypothetical protein
MRGPHTPFLLERMIYHLFTIIYMLATTGFGCGWLRDWPHPPSGDKGLLSVGGLMGVMG